MQSLHLNLWENDLRIFEAIVKLLKFIKGAQNQKRGVFKFARSNNRPPIAACYQVVVVDTLDTIMLLLQSSCLLLLSICFDR